MRQARERFANEWPKPHHLPTRLKDPYMRGESWYRGTLILSLSIMESTNGPARLDCGLRVPKFKNAVAERDHARGHVIYLEDDGCRRRETITWGSDEPDFSWEALEMTIEQILTEVIKDTSTPKATRDAVQPFAEARTPQRITKERECLRTGQAAVTVGRATPTAVAPILRVSVSTAKRRLLQSRNLGVIRHPGEGATDTDTQLLPFGERLQHRYGNLLPE